MDGFCESCRLRPATAVIRFCHIADERFAVCAPCAKTSRGFYATIVKEGAR